MSRARIIAIKAVMVVLGGSMPLMAQSISDLAALLAGSGVDISDLSNLAAGGDLGDLLSTGTTSGSENQGAFDNITLPSPRESLNQARNNPPGNRLAQSRTRVSRLVNAARAGRPNFGSDQIELPPEQPSFWQEIKDGLIAGLMAGFLQQNLGGTSGQDGQGSQDNATSGGGTLAPPQAGPFPF